MKAIKTFPLGMAVTALFVAGCAKDESKPAAEGGEFGRLLEACILLERAYNGEEVKKEIGEFLYEP